jgi:hypothetical protein
VTPGGSGDRAGGEAGATSRSRAGCRRSARMGGEGSKDQELLNEEGGDDRCAKARVRRTKPERSLESLGMRTPKGVPVAPRTPLVCSACAFFWNLVSVFDAFGFQCVLHAHGFYVPYSHSSRSPQPPAPVQHAQQHHRQGYSVAYRHRSALPNSSPSRGIASAGLGSCPCCRRAGRRSWAVVRLHHRGGANAADIQVAARSVIAPSPVAEPDHP